MQLIACNRLRNELLPVAAGRAFHDDKQIEFYLFSANNDMMARNCSRHTIDVVRLFVALALDILLMHM